MHAPKAIYKYLKLTGESYIFNRGAAYFTIRNSQITLVQYHNNGLSYPIGYKDWYGR